MCECVCCGDLLKRKGGEKGKVRGSGGVCRHHQCTARVCKITATVCPVDLAWRTFNVYTLFFLVGYVQDSNVVTTPTMTVNNTVLYFDEITETRQVSGTQTKTLWFG